MRVLLSGYYGFGNIGDELILASIVQEIQTLQERCEIDVLSAAPDATARTYGVNATPRWDTKAVRAAIDRADAVLSGGGGLLQNVTSLRSLLYYCGVIRSAVRVNRRTMIFAQSIGPLDFWGKRIVREACKGVAAATLRDRRSLQLLGGLLPGVRMERTADPVFLYNAMPATDVEMPAGTVAVVCLRKWRRMNEYAQTIARAVDRLQEKHGMSVVFLPLGGMSDAEISTQVIRKCRTAPMLLPHPDAAQAASLIARAGVVIGMRLHALILAARYAVPFLAIDYDPKVRGLREDLEYPLQPLLRLDERGAKDTSEKTGAAIDELCRRREELAEHLRGRLPAMQTLARRNFEILFEVLAA